MQLHHSKHHQTYVNNLNAAEEKLSEATAKKDVSAAIALQPALKFNGGGHINHSIFWKNLCPKGEAMGAPGAYTQFNSFAFNSNICLANATCHVSKPNYAHAAVSDGDLMKSIERDFGSFDAMKEKLSASTVAVQGSGWGWLGYNKASGTLQIAACPNQVRKTNCS
jgi:Fe-Mn family superoxide dismutase